MSHPEQIEVPLFPLPNVVLFPGVMLPLHIFEERYKDMINTCIEDDSPFGVILLTGADETPSSIQKVGVLARVSDVERLDDGRMNIMTAGEVRFRIARFTATEPAWRAEVELLDDQPESDSVLAPLSKELSELYMDAYRKGIELTGERAGTVDFPKSAVELSFMVTYVIDMEVEAKQELLESTSTEDRLRGLIDYLKSASERLTEQVRQKRLSDTARGNGDLGRPESIPE
jgi:ATP-dependent Lon protease